MSAVTTLVTALTCDGYNATCGLMYRQPFKVAVTRRMAALLGWSVRPFQDRQLDLCPECTRRYNTNPPSRGIAHGGRPPKTKAGATP